jgi:N6-adenosine-specific RNA methylase IME4
MHLSFLFVAVLTSFNQVRCMATKRSASPDGDEQDRGSITHVDIVKANQRNLCAGYVFVCDGLIERPWPVVNANSDRSEAAKIRKKRRLKSNRALDGRISTPAVQSVQTVVREAAESAYICIKRRPEKFKSCAATVVALGKKLPLAEILHGNPSSYEVHDTRFNDLKPDENAVRAHDIIGRLTLNQSQDRPVMLTLETEKGVDDVQFYMPPRGGFLWTDLLPEHGLPSGWHGLLEHARHNAPPSLILLDPPWPNISAQRQNDRKASAYSTVDDLYDLWRIREPVSALLDTAGDTEPALVACWITNHAKVQSFALDKLFPAWRLDLVGSVAWLKLTTNAELIFPLSNAQGRKPYEILLLGRRATSSRTPKGGGKIDVTVLTSVPTDHSRKPPLDSIFEKLEPRMQINVYELFARNLPAPSDHQGTWISVGNEPFTYNQLGVGLQTVDQRE